MAWRILASLTLLLSVLFMPFGLSVLLALAGMIYFRFFFEAVILFLLSDLLYGTGEARFLNLPFVSLIVSLLVLAMVELIKRKIKIPPRAKI